MERPSEERELVTPPDLAILAVGWCRQASRLVERLGLVDAESKKPPRFGGLQLVARRNRPNRQLSMMVGVAAVHRLLSPPARFRPER